MPTLPFDFIRYLAAKTTVDDRALNRLVWQRLHDELAARPQQPVRVLEVAAGIGTMLERLTAWELLTTNTEYTAIDMEAAYIAEAARRLPHWATAQGFRVRQKAAGIFELHREGQQLRVVLEAIELSAFIEREREQGQRAWDLLVAHAFLDLVDLPTMLPRLFSLLKAGGLYYFSINFDGETILLPTLDPTQDAHISQLYHRAMDETPPGQSQTGRALLQQLPAVGGSVLAAGSSDWVVFPQDGAYGADEAYFLRCIIQTMAHTLGHQPQFEAWFATRLTQIERAELAYIAHQLDFVGHGQARRR